MNNSNKLFDILGIEPNEEFHATGQDSDVMFRITPILNVEWRNHDGRWRQSGVELRWFILGRYSNGTPLSILKMHKTETRCCPYRQSKCCCICQ